MSDPWIILEPYYGGSHRALVDGLRARLDVEFQLWTLPARKWKWRMRGAAPIFAERWRQEMPKVAGIFTSSLLNVAELRGLLPAASRGLPIILYFHENQLNYPVQVGDPRDYHYGWINILSALAADRLIWNSAYNRDSFLDELDGFVGSMPDHRPEGLAERIAGKSEVLPVPIDPGDPPRRTANERCRILWNHRWEHDKGPEEFFETLFDLADEKLEFELAVLGESFRESPAIFGIARERLESRIRTWGFLESHEDYRKELDRADLVVSTALHEFQGLAVLEAAARGARPLVPKRLAYPEIWPEDFLYESGGLRDSLRRLIGSWPAPAAADPREISLRLSWDSLLPRWKRLF